MYLLSVYALFVTNANKYKQIKLGKVGPVYPQPVPGVHIVECGTKSEERERSDEDTPKASLLLFFLLTSLRAVSTV